MVHLLGAWHTCWGRGTPAGGVVHFLEAWHTWWGRVTLDGGVAQLVEAWLTWWGRSILAFVVGVWLMWEMAYVAYVWI